MRTIGVLITLLALSAAAGAQWLPQPVGTNASFRGLSAVSRDVVWASGTAGTVIRTLDGGATWQTRNIPEAEKLDLRDIEAFDAETAYALSIGNGDSSRIYKTTDGGKSWLLQFKNTDEKAFFDAIACWDAKNCLAMSDPVAGRFLLMRTADGENWDPVPAAELPAAKEGEAAFAASGTCLIVDGEFAYLATGGSDARVYRSADRGRSWKPSSTPLAKGTSGSGVFSIAADGKKHIFVVGGDYERPSERLNTAAISKDGGKKWQAIRGMSGYRSGVAYVDRGTLVAVGTNGSDISKDGGKSWVPLCTEDLNVVAAANGTAWAAGPKGGVFRLTLAK